MMKLTIKKITLVSLGALSLFIFSCGVQKQKALQNSSDTLTQKSLLWEISGNGLTQPSYIFGTIHMICNNQFLWTPVMDSALHKSKQLAFEMNIKDPQITLKVSQGMLLSNGQTLSDYFSPLDYRKVVQFASDSLGLPEMMVSKMKPFALLTLLSVKRGNPCEDGSTAYETKLSGWGEAAQMKFAGLESAEDQLAIFDKMNTDSTAQQILSLIEHPVEADTQMNQLMKAYLAQDINSLQNLIKASPDMKADLNTLLYNRNAKWIPEIEKLINDTPTFIAVGAGHLGGEKGVLSLLKQKGYHLKALK